MGIISAVFVKLEWVTIIIFCSGGLLLVTAVLGYFYFTFKNPDYLRSEEYHLRKQSLEILGDKDNQLNPNVKEVKYVSSPYSLKGLNDGNIKEHEE